MKHYFKDIEKEDNLNYYMQVGFLVSFIPIFLTLFFIKAYYGKFYDSNKTKNENSILSSVRKLFPVISSRISWIIQECPSVFVTLYYLLKYQSKLTKEKIIVISPFLIHYIQRSFIFPFVIHSSKNYPFELTLMAFSFCLFNSLIINRSVILFSDYDKNDYFSIFCGILIMFFGMFINIYHDYSMSKQRTENNKKPNSSHYIIPRGFLYEYISCPNYLGELTEWLGFILISKTFSSFVFFVSTFCNLFPRAIKYHQWYRTKFKDEFAKDEKLSARKAIIPFII